METASMEKELEASENEKVSNPCILEVVNVEELAVDGICGIY